MTTSVGGSSGVVFPDSSVISANGVTAYLAPGMTDTANVMTIQSNTTINGTTGLKVNGGIVSSATPFYPINTVAPVVTGTAQETQTLTCSTGTWTSSTTITYSYQWIRGTSTNVGTNSSTYTCVAGDVGSTIRCVVTADNGTSPVPSTSNTVGPIASYAPANTVLPAITGIASETQTLTCSTGTWTNSPTSYSYQWIRGASTNIGTNTNTYVCTTADMGSTIKCTVTATNIAGSTSATSNTVGPVTANLYTATYLVAAAGGGGGPGVSPDNVNAGGGGGGGVLTSTATLTPGTVYVAIVGGGGAPHVQGNPSSLTNQSTSAIISSTVGGGYGGYNYDDYRDSGGNGGCGGGQGRGANGGASPGSGTAGQGYGGSNGGGGAGVNNAGYTGGTGLYSAITGNGNYYGGGGGSSGGNAGGAGGGGQGGNAFGAPGPTGISGGVNTGGGGGACGGYTNGAGSGGSGVVILSVPTTRYSGIVSGSPSVSVFGGMTIIQFNSSGTYTA